MERFNQLRDDHKMSENTVTHFEKLKKLLEILITKELPDTAVQQINVKIDEVNSFTGSEKTRTKVFEKAHHYILKVVQKEANLVTKNYYTYLWMVLGISSFGIPLGIVFGLSLDNIAFLGIGLPIGISLGIGVGSSLDAKAMKEGKILDL